MIARIIQQSLIVWSDNGFLGFMGWAAHVKELETTSRVPGTKFWEAL
jgi:hypothetical protein